MALPASYDYCVRPIFDGYKEPKILALGIYLGDGYYMQWD